jgi:hypothetical protein
VDEAAMPALCYATAAVIANAGITPAIAAPTAAASTPTESITTALHALQ